MPKRAPGPTTNFTFLNSPTNAVPAEAVRKEGALSGKARLVLRGREVQQGEQRTCALGGTGGARLSWERWQCWQERRSKSIVEDHKDLFLFLKFCW